jgi:hypothetical protein
MFFNPDEATAALFDPPLAGHAETLGVFTVGRDASGAPLTSPSLLTTDQPDH